MVFKSRFGIVLVLCGALVDCGAEPGTAGELAAGGRTSSAVQGGAMSSASGEAGAAASGAPGSAGQPLSAGSSGASGSSGAGAIAGVATSGGAASSNGGASAGGTSGGAASGGTASGGGRSGSGGSAGATLSVCTGIPARAVTVYVIGDSTASVYASDLFPRMGWGQPLGELFGKACAVVSDKALSGRSSKSFYDEGAWTPVRAALKSGDYVLIQFGHNDEKSDEPTLYTEPQTTYKQYLTKYVDEARAKQAIPVLLTSINRNSWSGATLKDTHGAYPPAMRELAAALKVDLIDMTALSKQYFERLGQTETTKLFLNLAAGQFPNYPNGNTDNTHFQESGARKIGQLAMSNAYGQGLTLASLLEAIPSTP